MRPFLDTIESERTTGSVTGVALGSLHKLLQSVVPQEAPNVSFAMAAVARSLSHCRFEASDVDGDQSTLSRILRCITACITAPCGEMIPDESILELFEACFRFAIPVRSRHVSQMLRSLAESTLIDFIHATFARFRKFMTSNDVSMTSSSDDVLKRSGASNGGRRYRRKQQLTTESPYTIASLLSLFRVVAYLLNLSSDTPTDDPQLATPSSSSSSSSVEESSSESAQKESTGEGSSSSSNGNNADENGSNGNGEGLRKSFEDGEAGKEKDEQKGGNDEVEGEEDEPITKTPHLGFLATLASHLSQKRRAETQYLGLNMASVIIDTCGPAMRFLPGFMSVMREDLLCSVLKLLDSSQPAVLAISLRVFVNAYFACKPLLKLHYEMFLARCFRMVLDDQGIQ